ncbi:hypothetical protein [Chitinophaga sp. YIM B06452]|uniref:hypothetical protein n=1 Tax=Chitinophaga sp. YIM B06452 TaxID=3082158 RepID=UPI0031FE9070
MSIDIHISNYEEYLYSYVDGELTPEEILALELFIDQHPHLRAELDQLMATRLQPEPLVFSNKASLYKSSQAQEENFESRLLSYMDGELSPQAAKELEAFMDVHPQLRQELAVWEKTRLEPDLSVRFENKPVLYRHAARTVRMRPAYWWAAAAVLAGALFLLRNSFMQDDPATPAVTAANQPAQPADAGVVENKASTQPVPAETVPAPPLVKENTVEQAPAQKENTVARPVLAQASSSKTANTETVPNNDVERAAIAADLSSLRTHAPEPAARQAVSADLTNGIPKVKESETVLAMNGKPSIDIQAAAPLATPPPAQEPGELIMSVTGNGLESKVLDKVTNVAKLFSRKRNNK